MTTPARVWPVAACARASPKSHTLHCPSTVSSTFSGFTSRCTTPATWAAASPDKMASMIPRAASAGNRPRSRSRLRSVRPGTYSIARYRYCPSDPWSKTATMLGWDSRATDLASPMNLPTKSASRASSACITLSATCRSSRVSVARYTVAMPPCAMRERTRYRPSSTRPISPSARTDSIGCDFTAPCQRLGAVNHIVSTWYQHPAGIAPGSVAAPRPAVPLNVMNRPERTVVTGAGLAGLRTAQELRAHGYAGAITLVGAEDRPPYDRPPLSKKVLTDGIDPSLHADFAALDADFRPGEAAVGLEPSALVTDRGKYSFDHLVVATGAVPVALPGPGRQRFLRTYDDALALRALLRPGLRLAIVGAGWIGAELATAAAAAGCRVTVVEAGPAPLATALGPEAGSRTAPWYDRAGVE